MFTTWTVEITYTQFGYDEFKLFRTEGEADNFIQVSKTIIARMGLTNYATITKDSHTVKS